MLEEELLVCIDLLAKVPSYLSCLQYIMAEYVLFDFICLFKIEAMVYLSLNELFLFLNVFHQGFEFHLGYKIFLRNLVLNIKVNILVLPYLMKIRILKIIFFIFTFHHAFLSIFEAREYF